MCFSVCPPFPHPVCDSYAKYVWATFQGFSIKLADLTNFAHVSKGLGILENVVSVTCI